MDIDIFDGLNIREVSLGVTTYEINIVNDINIIELPTEWVLFDFEIGVVDRLSVSEDLTRNRDLEIDIVNDIRISEQTTQFPLFDYEIGVAENINISNPSAVKNNPLKVYWYGGTGNWSDGATHWSRNSGNLIADGIAAPNDTSTIACWDGNSGIGTCTINSVGGSIGGFDFTGVSPNLTIAGSASFSSFYGNLTLQAGMSLTCTSALSNMKGTNIITSNGVVWKGYIQQGTSSGTIILADDFVSNDATGYRCTLGQVELNGHSCEFKVIQIDGADPNTRGFKDSVGGGSLRLSGNNTVLWLGIASSSVTLTNIPYITCTYTGSVGTRSFRSSTTHGSLNPSFKFIGGTDIISFDSGAVLGDLDFTGFSGTLANTSFSASSLKLSDTMTATAGASTITLNGNGTTDVAGIKYIKTGAGKVFPSNLTINGTGKTFQLEDDLSTAYNFIMTAGTLNPNGKNFTFTGATPTYTPTVVTNFYNLSLVATTPAAANVFSIAGAGGTIISNNLTINHGTDNTKRLLVSSSSFGTQRSISVGGVVSAENVDFRDILGIGSATWDVSGATYYTGDCGGNTFKALGAAAFTTATNQIWNGTAGGNFSTVARWTSRIPLPQDTAIFNGVDLGTSQTIVQDLIRCPGINFTGATWTTGFTFTMSTACDLYGSLILITGMTLGAATQTYTLRGRHGITRVLDTAGLTLTKAVIQDNWEGTYQIGAGDFILAAAQTYTLTSGNLDLNGNTFSTGIFNTTGTVTRAILDVATGGSFLVTGNATTVWTSAVSTGLTCTPIIDFNYSGATGTRTITGSSTELGSAHFSITAGTDATTITAGIRSLNFTGYSGTTANSVRTIYGNLTVPNTGTHTGGANATTFAATSGTKSITTNTKTLDYPITINGVGGTFQLADNLTMGVTRTLTVTNGTFNTNSFVLSTGLFTMSGVAQTINLGSETHLLTGTGTVFTGTLGTLSGSYTLKISDISATGITFAGGGRQYNNIWFSRGLSTGTNTITGANTFASFVDGGTTAHIDTFPATTINTFASLAITGRESQLITLSSATAGTRTILIDTAGTNTCNYILAKDTLVSGGATWVGGANSSFINSVGWSDLPAAPTRYWVSGGNGNWSSNTNWSATDGGPRYASIPTGDTDVFFTANSGSGISTINSASAVGNLNFTGFTGTLAGSGALTLNGSLTLGSGMTITYTGAIGTDLTFANNTITSNSKTLLSAVTLGKALLSSYVTDSWTLQDDFSATGLVLTQGTFNSNNKALTLGSFNSVNSNVRTLNLGTNTWTITGTGTAWRIVGLVGITLNPSTSTIKMTNTSSSTVTFEGGVLTYNNLWFARGASSGESQVGVNTTFNDIKDDGTIAHNLSFQANMTTTCNTFTVNGNPGNVITIKSTTPGTRFVLNNKKTIVSDYLSISDSVVTGTAYAGANSVATNTIGVTTSDNVGWIFAAPSTVIAGQATKSSVGVSGAVVRLIRQIDNVEVDQTTTDGSGNYSFYAPSTNKYHVCIEYTDGGVKYNAKSLWELTPA